MLLSVRNLAQVVRKSLIYSNTLRGHEAASNLKEAMPVEEQYFWVTPCFLLSCASRRCMDDRDVLRCGPQMFFKSPHQALPLVAKTDCEPRYEKTKP